MAIGKRRIYEWILVAGIVGGMALLYFLGRPGEIKNEDISSGAELELRGKFSVARYEQGELKLWSQGKEFRYFRGKGSYEILEPAFEFETGQGKISVGGEKAVYQSNEKRIQISGAVEVRGKDFMAFSEQLNYEPDSGMISGEKRIKVQGAGWEIEGTNYKLMLEEKKFELSKGVKGQFEKQGI